MAKRIEEMRLIDADALWMVTEGDHEYYERFEIENAPTVDAVPVVRCKDCKHRDPEDHKCDSGALERAGCIFPVQDDYFCSFGERREDGKTN